MSFEIRVERQMLQGTVRADVSSDEPLTALFGPSGAGKTSVLNMVAGVRRPCSGRIVVGGRTLFDSSAGIDVSVQQRRAGYVFQDGRLFPHMRVRDNLLYGWNLAERDNRWMALEEATAFLGIGHLLERWPRTLSGGEAQRVAIGRALLAGPAFLLMDEPLASLDLARRREIMDVVARIRDELKLPILYVSHDRSELRRLKAAVVTLG